ncbi:hypothetical protein LTR08_006870 [Meristemomyces frigidus]|nr:hypothetical protein LTR08_006870 [Meristemomyces frigidus]
MSTTLALVSAIVATVLPVFSRPEPSAKNQPTKTITSRSAATFLSPIMAQKDLKSSAEKNLNLFAA